MNLEDFIAQSLSQIAKGIEKANDELSASKAIVSPKNIKDVQKNNPSTFGKLELRNGEWSVVQNIEFDVAVTASQGSEAKAGAGISVGAITLGATGKEDNKNTSVSRIKFSIPMLLPLHEKNA